MDQKYEGLINAIWSSNVINEDTNGEVKTYMAKEKMQLKVATNHVQPKEAPKVHHIFTNVGSISTTKE